MYTPIVIFYKMTRSLGGCLFLKIKTLFKPQKVELDFHTICGSNNGHINTTYRCFSVRYHWVRLYEQSKLCSLTEYIDSLIDITAGTGFLRNDTDNKLA